MIKFAIFVRHGESLANTMNLVSDDIEKYPLTEKGREQVKKVGAELKKIHVDQIVSSPILRAFETAQIISSFLDLPVKIDDRLMEIRFGKFNNGPFDKTPKFTYLSNELESWENIKKRMLSIMDDYDGNIVLVSHAFPIRVVIASYLNLEENESYGISIGNAKLSIINVPERKVLAIGSPLITENLKLKLSD